jgi:5-guanidino-2-oxopentanoate decarboxylase
VRSSFYKKRISMSTNQPLTCGEALFQLLSQYQVDTIFGIPGTHTLELYRGIARSNLRHIQPRHEQGAGFMADGYARVTGKPGVYAVISGPGVTNAATPLGQAYADSIPLLLISSDAPAASLGKGWGCLHEITSQQAVTTPLTALSATVRDPDELPELIGQAFSIFAAARPRPVHLSIPTDLLGQPVRKAWTRRQAPARPMPDPAALQAAALLLASATRPLLIIGGGLVSGQASDLQAARAVQELAEWLGAAVIATNAGKGLLADTHPLNLGASLSRATTRHYLAQADVVLVLGSELAETDSFVERLPINGQLIRVDLERNKLSDLYQAEIGIIGDASASAAQLLALLKIDGHRASAVDQQGEIATVCAQLRAELSPLEQQHERVCGALRAALPPESVVMTDMTQITYTGSFTFPTAQARRWIYAGGYCTLGCALPMAIGAKLAQPKQPVAALVGDGGLLFTVQELATAAELGLALPVIVWNNEGYGEIRDGMVARGIPPTGVSGRNPDFVALAYAFGGQGLRPNSLAALTDAVTQALQTPGPTLIEVHQDAPWLI